MNNTINYVMSCQCFEVRLRLNHKYTVQIKHIHGALMPLLLKKLLLITIHLGERIAVFVYM